MSAVNVFVSFDIAHDQDLYELLLEQSRVPGSSFEVCACSEPPRASNSSNERLRKRIRGADQMIVICGEHTHDSVPMSVELEIAREEEVRHFLLWGRRELMCSKPISSKPAEGMYSWTRQILQERVAFTIRKARSDEDAASLRRVRPTGR